MKNESDRSPSALLGEEGRVSSLSSCLSGVGCWLVRRRASGLTAGLGVSVCGTASPSTGHTRRLCPLRPHAAHLQECSWASWFGAHNGPAAGSLEFLGVLVRGSHWAGCGLPGSDRLHLCPRDSRTRLPGLCARGPSCLRSVPGVQGRELVLMGFLSIVAVSPVQRGFGGSLSSLCWTRLRVHCD